MTAPKKEKPAKKTKPVWDSDEKRVNGGQFVGQLMPLLEKTVKDSVVERAWDEEEKEAMKAGVDPDAKRTGEEAALIKITVNETVATITYQCTQTAAWVTPTDGSAAYSVQRNRYWSYVRHPSGKDIVASRGFADLDKAVTATAHAVIGLLPHLADSQNGQARRAAASKRADEFSRVFNNVYPTEKLSLFQIQSLLDDQHTARLNAMAASITAVTSFVVPEDAAMGAKLAKALRTLRKKLKEDMANVAVAMGLTLLDGSGKPIN